MRTEKDVWIVAAPLSAIKIVEGVFVANDCRYWTEDGKDHTKSSSYYINSDRLGTKKLINVKDLRDFIIEHNLGAEVKAALSEILVNKTIFEWLEDNKVRRSTNVYREP